MASSELPAHIVPSLRLMFPLREVRAVILHGSRSRNQHRPDSDWDVTVVLDGVGTADRQRGKELALFPGLQVKVYSERRIHLFKDIPFAIEEDIASGRRLYGDLLDDPGHRAPPAALAAEWLRFAERRYRARRLDDDRFACWLLKVWLLMHSAALRHHGESFVPKDVRWNRPRLAHLASLVSSAPWAPALTADILDKSAVATAWQAVAAAVNGHC